MNNTSTQEVKNLKLRLNILYVLVIMLLSCFLYILRDFINNKNSNDEIIYAKGIVIVDDQGRDRILIGAPIPNSNDRIRDDLKKAQGVWGTSLELNKEWDWFEEMNHDCFGILVLDENGHDRLAFGSPTPDPNIGLRIGPATGVQINDEYGFERSGYAYMPLGEDRNRVVLGLDNPNSSEGTTLSILEDGTAGLSVFNSKTRSSLFLGNSEANSYMTPGKSKYFGLAVKDSTGRVNVANKEID